MVAVKVGLSITIIAMFLTSDKRTLFLQYFWTLMLILLTFAQLFVGYKNIQVIHTFKDLRTDQLDQYVVPREQLTRDYINDKILMLYIPMIVSLFAFKAWEWCFKEE